MKLFYRKFGEGKPFIILHGLFGQSDNWNTLARQFGDEGFEVYSIDLRNHGQSPHSNDWNYKVMSDDVLELINDLNLRDIVLLGHSMGGKVAMEFALQHQEFLNKLIVVDIAPKYYAPHHESILKALNAVDFKISKSRKEVENTLSQYITDLGTKQFLLKNIYWKENGELDWRFNLKVITDKIETVGQESSENDTCSIPTLFIRGDNSQYIKDEDLNLIQRIFPSSTLKTIRKSGHWVHAEQPTAFFEAVREFIIS